MTKQTITHELNLIDDIADGIEGHCAEWAVILRNCATTIRAALTDKASGDQVAKSNELVEWTSQKWNEYVRLIQFRHNVLIERKDDEIASLTKEVALLNDEISEQAQGRTLPDYAIEAGAKWMAENVMRYKWSGLGHGCVDPRFPPWQVGGVYNAQQGDFCDAVRGILAAIAQAVAAESAGGRKVEG